MAERINALYHKKKLYPLYSALLTALIFILILAFNGIAGFGNKTILTGDLFSQYVSFIRHFIDILKGKAGFYYSFSLYLGNSSAANNSYYCLSPFNLLYLIPGISLSAMTAVIITLKLALSAASFQFYLAKGLKGGRPVSILFGTAYALSCFSVTMSMHIMWLDCLYILPVLLLLMMRFIKGGSFLPLIPAYAFLFLSNFYMAYIAGIFTAFCFIGLIIIHTDSFDKASLMSALRKGGLGLRAHFSEKHRRQHLFPGFRHHTRRSLQSPYGTDAGYGKPHSADILRTSRGTASAAVLFFKGPFS